MAALDQRGATLDLSELCASCREPLSAPAPSSAGPSGGALPPFYLFPSGNAFHGSCLCQLGADLAVPAQRTRIEYLQQTLAAAVCTTNTLLSWQAQVLGSQDLQPTLRLI